jgi:hypothetical protein
VIDIASMIRLAFTENAILSRYATKQRKNTSHPPNQRIFVARTEAKLAAAVGLSTFFLLAMRQLSS